MSSSSVITKQQARTYNEWIFISWDQTTDNITDYNSEDNKCRENTALFTQTPALTYKRSISNNHSSTSASSSSSHLLMYSL
ncbi:putative bifunctional tRNA threonylcarbamoyladenosine biosynthesis protein [Labeo rohita]|uniref:Bifunctional tRNA threonylcarbamoyladenosine biosynthesis protein n=1 Tax=Labeo rohita TaxID=84645 RepID=A0ABQ8LZ36_LABRO|nr:putative bifunctional tRNA threonylcarbamoyladenosine biosynthesis protein [Labeo rohita]